MVKLIKYINTPAFNSVLALFKQFYLKLSAVKIS